MVLSDSPGCKQGEICLGQISPDAAVEYSARMMIRMVEAADAERRLNIYVDERELKNFLKQEAIVLEEKWEIIRKHTAICENLHKLSKAYVKDEQYPDEVFIGCFANECNAGYVFGQFQSIRGGALAEEELMRFYDEKGRLKEAEVVQTFYYFVDRREFEAYLKEIEEEIAHICEDYKLRDGFYSKIKKYEGG
jgi:hypothetical protein